MLKIITLLALYTMISCNDERKTQIEDIRTIRCDIPIQMTHSTKYYVREDTLIIITKDYLEGEEQIFRFPSKIANFK